MTSGNSPLRIGTAERTAAMKALDEHLSAGRLGVEEYADRSAVAADATVASELAGLFTDLPAPHPTLPGVAAPPPTAAMPVVGPQTAPLPAVAPSGSVAERANGVLEGWGPKVVAVMPFVALLLFFTVGGWWWFLLIPAAGALVYGGGVGHDDEDEDESDRVKRRRGRRGRRR